MKCCVSMHFACIHISRRPKGRVGLKENFLIRGSCSWTQGSCGRPDTSKCYCYALRILMGLASGFEVVEAMSSQSDGGE